MAMDQASRILLVDDDRDLLDLLRYNFQKEGFHVKTVSKARKAIDAAREFRAELIVLDLSLPDGSGVDLCREIRNLNGFKSIPIFFLSACSANSCREKALEVGADDFIEKLSGLRALTNKVIAVLKHKFVIKKGVCELASDDLVIKKKAQVVYMNEKRIALSSPEFDILFFLMQNPNRNISRSNLVKVIWGSEIFVRDTSVENCVKTLQLKIGTKFIQTVDFGQYRFVQRRRQYPFRELSS